MKKILLIDDDDFGRRVNKRKLDQAGFNTEEAVNGKAGLVKMKSFKPDLVFMDLIMPEMDGFEAIEKAKADPDIKNIPIVALTNLSSPEDARQVIAKGALEIIVKSNIDPDEVVNQARKILNLN